MDSNFGFVRVAAAVPRIEVANCDYNAEQIKLQIDEAVEEGVQIICFPELAVTGYTCADLFFLQQKKGWSVGLLPKEKTIRKAIASIVLEGDKDLKKVELVDGEGNILTYEFKQSGK